MEMTNWVLLPIPHLLTLRQLHHMSEPHAYGHTNWLSLHLPPWRLRNSGICIETRKNCSGLGPVHSVNPEYPQFTNIEALIAFIHSWDDIKGSLPYATDGRH